MSLLNSQNTATALEFAQQLPDLIHAAKGRSLIEYTKPTRVEPTAIVDSQLSQLPYAEDVMHTSLNIFAAYYMQAVSLIVNVGNINVLKVLSRLDPDRSVDPRYSFEGKLPLTLDEAFSLESDSGYGVDSKDIRDLNADANLSVGKLLQVKIKHEDSEATFPVQLRLRARSVRTDSLIHTLALSSKDRSLGERWHRFKAGELSFVKDIIFAQDLIEEHREHLHKDDSGFYKQTVNRRRQNFITTVLDPKNASLATASSMIFLTSDSAKKLELQIRGRLSNFKTREKLFQETLSMLIVVVDPDQEAVTIYSRSIEDESVLTISEIKRKSKNGQGPDILEILKALKGANAPTF